MGENICILSISDKGLIRKYKRNSYNSICKEQIIQLKVQTIIHKNNKQQGYITIEIEYYFLRTLNGG